MGETYVDASSGLVVRVLDSKRSTQGLTGSFVVESATRARPGERWACREKDLQEPRGALPSLEAVRRSGLLRVAQEALLCTEQVLGGREDPVGSDIARVAAKLRLVADELASFAPAGCAVVEGGPA